jgi:hypothetical protein
VNEPPELWWAPSRAAGRNLSGVLFASITPGRVWVLDEVAEGLGLVPTLIDLPDDAALLVPAEVLDAKGRGPTYWRGHADGRLAERAGVDGDAPDPNEAGIGDVLPRRLRDRLWIAIMCGTADAGHPITETGVSRVLDAALRLYSRFDAPQPAERETNFPGDRCS